MLQEHQRIPSFLFREIVDSAPDATVMINARGRIILANKQTRNLFGYDNDEMLGRPVEILIPETLRQGHEGHRDSYFKTPKAREMGANIELTAVHKDGHEFPVEISLSPLSTDAGTFATASIRDASARKQAQEQVGSLLEAAPAAMIVVNQEGNIAVVNAQTERLFSYPREELIGKPVELLMPKGMRSGHEEHRRNYFVKPKVREMGAGRELAGQRKDGSEFPIEISLSPLQTETDLLAIAAVRDVSERKATEEKMRQYAKSLETSNRELEQFAYVASHDLQAPLRNVVSYSQLLRRELPDLNEKAQQYFQHMESNATHMRDLIHDLLQFSRVNNARAPHKPTELRQVTTDVLALLESEIRDQNAKISIGNLPTIDADPKQLTQLFQNLIGNAIKFHRPGTPPIIDIDVLPHNDDNFVCLFIKDNGIGMDADYRNKVFQIFTRLHSVEEYAGTGIGLAICKKIVENHNGSIHADSNADGNGCSFIFTLSKHAVEPAISSAITDPVFRAGVLSDTSEINDSSQAEPAQHLLNNDVEDIDHQDIPPTATTPEVKP